MKERAVFLDRDGTLIEERGHICSFSEVNVFSFSVEALKIMNTRDFKVILVTNQSSVARGICTELQVQDIHTKLREYFEKRGAMIDAVYYCPFHEEGIVPKYRKKDECRKPSPGMLYQAAQDFDIDLTKSYMIGDSLRDISAGQQAGCKTILVLTGHGRQAKGKITTDAIYPNYIAANLLEAVMLIK